jgi:hypothetical protein
MAEILAVVALRKTYLNSICLILDNNMPQAGQWGTQGFVPVSVT